MSFPGTSEWRRWQTALEPQLSMSPRPADVEHQQWRPGGGTGQAVATKVSTLEFGRKFRAARDESESAYQGRQVSLELKNEMLLC